MAGIAENAPFDEGSCQASPVVGNVGQYFDVATTHKGHPCTKGLEQIEASLWQRSNPVTLGLMLSALSLKWHASWGNCKNLPGLLTLELHMPGPTVLNCILSDARCAISKDSISGENSTSSRSYIDRLYGYTTYGLV